MIYVVLVWIEYGNWKYFNQSFLFIFSILIPLFVLIVCFVVSPIISIQSGFGYQQQLVPGMRPGGAPMPNYFVPMPQQGQRPSGRRGAGLVQQSQLPVPLMQQQVNLNKLISIP